MVESGENCLTSALRDTDTGMIDIRVGGRVRCIMDDLKGIQGLFTATRTGGRVLICVATGVYLELPRICVQQIDIAAE
jgi:hypothetical protein